MHVLKGPEYLIHNILLVDFFQDVGPDYGVQVCLHVLKDKINIAVVLCFQDIQEPV